MFTMCNAALTHVEIPRPRDATELNNDGMIKLGDVYHQTEPILSIFFERRLINDNSSFCSHILSATDLQCHVFPFEKLLMSVFVCKRHFDHLHVTMLQCWAKFSSGLVR